MSAERFYARSCQNDGYDLRTVVKAMGTGPLQRGLVSEPIERPVPSDPAALLDKHSRQVTAEPIDLVGAVDGIQAAVTLTWRAQRPTYLQYAAAGAMACDGQAVGLREELSIVCSAQDREWAVAHADGIPVTDLGDTEIGDVERLAWRGLAASRERLEYAMATGLLEQSDKVVLIDGGLSRLPASARLGGVVKTMSYRYLGDESCLYMLKPGWRSPRFIIAAGSQGCPHERYSAYLRLRDAGQAPWQYGLVRLETFDPELIDPLAARCLRERQGMGSLDPRGDRHLAVVLACEQFLRARRPFLFSNL